MTTNALPPIPALPSTLVEDMIARINAATDAVTVDVTMIDVSRARLPQSDLARVTAAAIARRAALVSENQIEIVYDAPVTPVAVSATPVAPVAPVSPDPSIVVPNLAGMTGRRPRNNRAQTAAAISAAVLKARSEGSRLAGYDGRVVDPGTGAIGTVIAFGYARPEYDPVSGRERQALIRWSTVEAALTSAGFEIDLLGSQVSRVAHLGQAVKIINHSGYIARAARSLGRGAWIVGKLDTSLDSDTLGDRECLITLQKDGSLTLSDPTHAQACQIATEYQNRVSAVLVEATDLRNRIERTLTSTFGARSTDLGLYVSPYHTDNAMRLIVALRPVAGRKIYAWTHTDRESISEALCDSFSLDVARLERDLDKSSDDLKKLAGASLIERCETLKAELTGIARVLGDTSAEAYRTRLDACDAKITASLDATSQRFAMMDLS